MSLVVYRSGTRRLCLHREGSGYEVVFSIAEKSSGVIEGHVTFIRK